MSEKVALFPIPNLVAFPGTLVPLHVFEPRYRQMVNEAVEQKRMIGVTHTRKEIHPGRRHETVEEALSSNQATYQPHEVFTAGHCEIVGHTEDGRIHAVVRAQKRMRIVEEVQTLPYRIVEAEELPDEADEAPEANRELQSAINERLIELIGDEHQELAKAMTERDWVDLSPEAFSFRIFQFLRFDPDLMQSILESTRTSERLRVIDDVLRSVS